MKNTTPIGTTRVKSKDLNAYEKNKTGWKLSKTQFVEVAHIAKMFKAHCNFKLLIDTKNPEFLKGQVSKEGAIQGARINQLPNGKVLSKAYSLFAKNLVVHDESSHDHWDALYENPGGGHSHLYTLDKVKNSTKEKYKTVEDFSKRYALLEKKVTIALGDRADNLCLPMYTLLKTYMRVGNETYYKMNGHAGLTTLKKKDLMIKGNNVIFTYISKKGVPMTIKQEFPSVYVSRLKKGINGLKNNDFIFSDIHGKPLRDTEFMGAFERYCGKRFYPHIVRSYYATQKAKEFLKRKRHATKEEVKELYMGIAEKLGHKKFDKKNNEWKNDYNVTIHYYLRPELVEKINEIVK